VGYITDVGSGLYMPGRSVFLFRQRRGFSLRYHCVQAGSVAPQFLFSGNGRINPTKSPDSGGGIVSELMSDVGTMREVVCA
jgi:hypothetical protein